MNTCFHINVSWLRDYISSIFLAIGSPPFSVICILQKKDKKVYNNTNISNIMLKFALEKRKKNKKKL